MLGAISGLVEVGWERPWTEGWMSGWVFQSAKQDVTLSEANIDPENGPLEKDIPIGNHHLQGLY